MTHHQHTLHDPHFGEITVHLEIGVAVEITGAAVPTGDIRSRLPEGGEPRPDTAIGTRKQAELTMTVGVSQARVRPARGHLTRGSYRVDVTHEGTRYRLIPNGMTGSRFLRNGGELAVVTTDEGHEVTVDWTATPLPADATVAYLLATAFGTGGMPLWMVTAEAIGALLPG
ncbi:hypothetical protein [Embleya sp. NBC_00896]|uniref:hypothetical protein n=1 Tax=Embleya sp. NBC_00896 TaxID=2975961 RepID=UPI00386D900A|nr:hypothetical protein OG928_31225 [Embleya sp. NBC_00896]